MKIQELEDITLQLLRLEKQETIKNERLEIKEIKQQQQLKQKQHFNQQNTQQQNYCSITQEIFLDTQAYQPSNEHLDEQNKQQQQIRIHIRKQKKCTTNNFKDFSLEKRKKQRQRTINRCQDNIYNQNIHNGINFYKTKEEMNQRQISISSEDYIPFQFNKLSLTQKRIHSSQNIVHNTNNNQHDCQNEQYTDQVLEYQQFDIDENQFQNMSAEDIHEQTIEEENEIQQKKRDIMTE